jgi:hypothetical protein
LFLGVSSFGDLFIARHLCAAEITALFEWIAVNMPGMNDSLDHRHTLKSSANLNG